MRRRLNPLIFAVGVLSACSAPQAEQYFLCSDDVTINTDVPTTEPHQEIAAHIKAGRINFSGNAFLLGENVPFC